MSSQLQDDLNSEVISFSLNGQTLQAHKGETILQVAKRSDIQIPHLCYKDGLKPDGNCRACMVEIDGERVLAPSCCRQPSEDMVVHSNNERAQKSQKMVLELLLSDMPDTQYTLHNELADWAKTLAVTQPRFESRPAVKPDNSHPLLL